jgi:hypothetical protein
MSNNADGSWNSGYYFTEDFRQRRTFTGDRYTARLLEALYENENIRVRTTNQNRTEIYILPAFDYNEEEWVPIPATLSYICLNEYNRGTGGGGYGLYYKIFISPNEFPVLIQILNVHDGVNNYTELRGIYRFENNHWIKIDDKDSVVINIFETKQEIEQKDLFCDFSFNQYHSFNIFELVLTAVVKKSGMEYPGYYSESDIKERVIFLWNGLYFMRQ